jgi:predicted glycosyltransferase
LRSLRHLARRSDTTEPVHSVVVLGPEMPTRKKERLLQRVTAAPGMVKILEFSTEILNYMNAADLVVSMGGYNTVCEILTLEKRAIVVPRVRPVTEQWIRTRRMQALGLIDSIHPERLTPEHMAEKVASALFDVDRTPREIANNVLDVDGLPRISRFVADQVRARSVR